MVVRSLSLTLVTGALLLGCNSSSDLASVGGAVSVDGSLVDIGTIQFRPAANPSSRGAGAAIDRGKFQLASNHGLKPGTYSVIIQASRNTGKTFQDPQRGPVPQLAQLTIVDSPKDVEVTADNCNQLNLSFTTRGK